MFAPRAGIVLPGSRLEPHSPHRRWRAAWATAILGALSLAAGVAPAAEPPPRLEFLHLTAHWDAYGDPEYLPFLAEARPELVQVGFYGAHFYSLAHTPHGKGYPAHFPVQGLDECGRWFENLNRQVHAQGGRVVGHINVKFLVGDPTSDEGPRGFFKFYRDLWNEKELGPRPVADPLELLERNADGTPITNNSYSIGGMKEYWGCLLNPHWRSVLKAWVKRGVERGLDGYMINYFYRHNCLCPHCQTAFRAYLGERFTPAELREKFAIANLAEHRFQEIVGWHDPKQSTPLRREMLRFSQIANKRAFDEVFLEYGRKLKPDLIVGQWNHLGNFSQIAGDERCLLPAELWGRGEDYLWYSSGDSAYFTDLEAGFLGELTLQCRYIRGAFDDKPFTMGKYEGTRIRAAIAELAANGGAPMGFYTRFKDPLARAEIVRYYRFLSRWQEIYRANRPQAETLLLFPRRAVHEGRLEALESFRSWGQKLLDAKILFDIRPDDLVTDAERARYRRVWTPLEGQPPDLAGSEAWSRFQAGPTVRVSLSRPAQGEELDLHLVNYDRMEPAQKRSAGGGIADEKPIAAQPVSADLVLPTERQVAAVEFLTPEAADPVSLKFQVEAGRVRFTTPGFLVYGVARVRLR